MKKLVYIAVLSVMLLCGCSKVAESGYDPVPVVDTMTAQKGTLTQSSTYIGRVTSDQTVTVVSQVSGTAKQVLVSVGDTVTAGQSLAQLDDDNAKLSLQKAQESYNSANANLASNSSGSSTLENQLEKAKWDYNNAQILFDSGAISQNDLKVSYGQLLSVESALSSAKANLESSRIAVEQAQYQLNQYQLCAPLDGVVESVQVEDHNYVNAGSIAFIITSSGNKTISFYVSDKVRQQLQPGQDISVNYQNIQIDGVLSQIGTMADSATGLFEIQATLNQADMLPEGIKAEITLITNRAEDMILLPCDALYFENGSPYTFVMTNQTAIKTPVDLLLYNTDQAAVSFGIEEGAEVIVSWSAVLRDGITVTSEVAE